MAAATDPHSWDRGCVQVYTGNGKGKTTAALGLALRAAGAGYSVYIGQFAKRGQTAELNALQRLADHIVVRQFGSGPFVSGRPTPAAVRAARNGIEESRCALVSGHYRVVILDEANVAVHLGLLEPEDLLRLIREKPAAVELVITGRNANRNVLAAADLITEMRNRRHYYDAGVPARAGIEI